MHRAYTVDLSSFMLYTQKTVQRMFNAYIHEKGINLAPYV